MYHKKRIAAVVPARGGSKGLPGKNICLLAGKPLILHTIDCVRAAGCVDYLVVTTDSHEIADVVRAVEVDVIERPASLATDNASGRDVFVHAVTWIEESVGAFDYFFYLQPTSPLRAPEDIVGALCRAFATGAETVLGVTPCEYHPFLCAQLADNGSMQKFLERGEVPNRQELPVFYRINGAIYLVKRRSEWKDFRFVAEGAFAYKMPPERSVDIDTVFELRFAEMLLSEKTTCGLTLATNSQMI
jgi:CMP-N-acetylneuraminic acid synthetase